jgi:ADP-heptose:LPS heptosyltransferase
VARLTGPSGPLPLARVAVLATTSEAEQAQPLIDSIAPARLLNLIGKTDLPVAAAVLRRCKFFIGNDSGLMHMSAAVGTPTLGLFGPSHISQYAPWGELTASVRTLKSYDEIVSAPGYDHRTTGTLMESLSVDMAEDTARALWQRVEAAQTERTQRQA